MSRKKTILLFAFSWFLLEFSFAQTAATLTSIRTRWDDGFSEWSIYSAEKAPADDEESDDFEENWDGWLRQRWAAQEDWTQWDFDCLGVSGSFRQKWKDDPTQWELRTFTGTIVTMRMRWVNDPTEWVVEDGTHTLMLKSRWTNQFDEWIAEDTRLGRLYLYTLVEDDPRDWAIEDNLEEQVSVGMRLGLVFLATHLTTPRN